jgi:hypothetical protein
VLAGDELSRVLAARGEQLYEGWLGRRRTEVPEWRGLANEINVVLRASPWPRTADDGGQRPGAVHLGAAASNPRRAARMGSSPGSSPPGGRVGYAGIPVGARRSGRRRALGLRPVVACSAVAFALTCVIPLARPIRRLRLAGP